MDVHLLAGRAHKRSVLLPGPMLGDGKAPDARDLLARTYAVISHRARRLTILSRHGSPDRLVVAYQELVIDCHSFLATVARKHLQATLAPGSTGSFGAAPGYPDISHFPGAKQLALLQAINALKDALNTLSRSIRYTASSGSNVDMGHGDAGKPDGPDPLEGDVRRVLEATRRLVEIVSKFRTHHEPDAGSVSRKATISKRPSFASLVGQFGTKNINRSLSDPTTSTSSRSNGIQKGRRPSGSRISLPLAVESHTTKKRTGTLASECDCGGRDIRRVIPVLSELGIVVGSSLQEVRILKKNLLHSCDIPTTSRAIEDMSITEACYEQALNRLLPLISSLASDGDHGHATAADLERLQQDLVEKDAKLNALTKECENTQRMNAALLEENAMLKADIEALNRRTSNLELCQTPRSEDTIRLSEFPLLSPATEIDGGDSYLGTSGIPSVAVSSPVLNYAEITMQNVSREPDTTAQRIHSGVIQAEALLNTVKQRRLAARSSMSSVKSTAIKSSRSLPEITGYTSLWYDFNRAFDADPKTTACLKIQRLWRGYVARKKLKNIKHRLMIVNEVLDTEASYVRGLLVLHKEYMLPLQEEKDEKSHSITPTDFDNMFGHLSEIMQFSQRLLDSMVDRVAYWHHEQCFGDIFIDAAESMKIYAHYINNYDLAMETLQRLLDNFTFAKRLQSLEKAASRSHDLKDLLITPVQRPPRYLLLLQELLKRTPEKHPDYENLVSAVKRIKRTVHTINERKKRHESMRKLHEAVRGSPIHLVATNRYMVFSGPVLELNERSTGVNDLKYHRHLLLFNDLLLCASPTSNITETNSANPEATQYDFKWALPLADIVTVIERDSNCFQVAWKAGASSGIRILYTRNQEEHTDWVKHFAHARKNQIRLSRQSTLEGAGLILPPTHLVVKTATRRKSLQTINQTIERLESEIQEEAKVIEGFQLLENLNSTKPESATKSAKSVPGPIKALATPFAPVIKSHNRPMLSWDRENWIGLLPGVKKLSRTLSLRGQRDESEKKLGVLKREVSRHQLLRQQLQTPPPLG